MSACTEQAGRIRFRLQMHRTAAGVRESAGEWLASAIAGLLLLGALPVLLPALLIARVHRERRLGKTGRAFTEYRLVRKNGQTVPVIGGWPRLWNVARGEVLLVGPEPRHAADLNLRSEPDRRIASVQPGLVCNWWIRRRTNVAYKTQTETDLEYVESRSLRTDLGIALRAVISLAYGKQGSRFVAVPRILGLPLDNITLAEAVDEVLRPAPRGKQVSFINVDCVNKSCSDREYREILRNSELRLADGIGLRIAGRILGSEIRQNVNGTDLFPVLCERMAAEGLSMFLLGGMPGVAASVAERIGAQFPLLKIAGVRDGYFRREDEESIVESINASVADVLLVAMGAPLQEKWIARNREKLQVRAALGVGGLFDFYSGRILRAPQWLRELGLEWTWRLIQEPGRMWRRYLVGNVVFLLRVGWSRLTRSNRQETGEMVNSL